MKLSATAAILLCVLAVWASDVRAFWMALIIAIVAVAQAIEEG